MNTRQLEYIVAISETLSFSETAKQLYVSQPSLSQYVKKVEAEIGADIFIRTTPLKLTYQGEIFVRYAKKVLEEEKRLKLNLADILDNKEGVITIGTGPLNAALVIPEITDEFLKRYPDIKVNVSESAESDLLDLLDNGTVDILLTVMNPQILDNYVVEEVAREHYVLAVPPKLDRKADEYVCINDELPIININECRYLSYIMQTNLMPAHIIFENLCRKEGFSPQTKVTCKNINTAIHFAGMGIGACFIPSSVLPSLKDELNCYRLEGDDANRVIKIIYRKSMNLTVIQNEYIKTIRAFYNKNFAYR